MSAIAIHALISFASVASEHVSAIAIRVIRWHLPANLYQALIGLFITQLFLRSGVATTLASFLGVPVVLPLLSNLAGGSAAFMGGEGRGLCQAG